MEFWVSWQIVENYCMENLFFWESLLPEGSKKDSFCRVYHNAVCIHIFVVRVRNVQCAVQYHYVSSCVTLHHHSSPFCIIDVWPCWILVFSGMINFFLGESLGRRCSSHGVWFGFSLCRGFPKPGPWSLSQRHTKAMTTTKLRMGPYTVFCHYPEKKGQNPWNQPELKSAWIFLGGRWNVQSHLSRWRSNCLVWSCQIPWCSTTPVHRFGKSWENHGKIAFWSAFVWCKRWGFQFLLGLVFGNWVWSTSQHTNMELLWPSHREGRSWRRICFL